MITLQEGNPALWAKVVAAGAEAASRGVGPVWDVGNQIVDETGMAWQNVAPGDPGVWLRVIDLQAVGGEQPLDADLTAIAALPTSVFGRSLLTPANAAAARAILDVPQSGASVPLGGSQFVASPTGVAATDRAAIQAAMDAAFAAGGGTVFLAVGTYALGTTGVTFGGDNVILRGQGRNTTKISYTGSSAALKNSDGTALRSRCGVERLTIYIQGASAGARGLEVENFYRGTFRDLLIDGTSLACTPLKLIGSTTQSTYYNLFDNVSCVGNTAAINIGEACNGSMFYGGVLEGTGYAVFIQPGSGTCDTCRFTNVNMATSGATIIQLGGGAGSANDHQFSDCRIEATAAIVCGSNALRNTFRDGSWSSGITFTRGDLSNSAVVPEAGIYFSTLTDPALAPTGALAENVSRDRITGAQNIFISARLGLYAIKLPKRLTISSISFMSNTTAAVAPTAQWFSLQDSSRNKLAVTADDGATAWAASFVKTLFLSRAVTDAAITSGTATLTSATAAFTSADVGKQVTVMGAGAAGVPLGTTAARVTIASVESATSCTLSANASTTIASGGTAYIATPYTTTSAGFFYVGHLVVAGTCPTLQGWASVGNAVTTAPPLGGVADTGLSTPATCPNPATTLAFNGGFPYFYVS